MDSTALRTALGSLKHYLNPEIFAEKENIETIRLGLQEGRLVSIRNAFKEIFAERVLRCLDEFTEWKVYEAYKNHFHYHHHNIYDEDLYPPDLKWCQQVFQHDDTKELVQQLSNRDCTGKVQFLASWYLPGDHSLPHSDLVSLGNDVRRQVAFIWHLTKNWKPAWGGHLYWCPRNRYLCPSFNTLILFVVNRDSWHFVTTVSPYAQSKRLAVNGWWTGKSASATSVQEESQSFEQPLIELI